MSVHVIQEWPLASEGLAQRERERETKAKAKSTERPVKMNDWYACMYAYVSLAVTELIYALFLTENDHPLLLSIGLLHAIFNTLLLNITTISSTFSCSLFTFSASYTSLSPTTLRNEKLLQLCTSNTFFHLQCTSSTAPHFPLQNNNTFITN